MTILEMAKRMFEYYSALKGEGFSPTEAMALTTAHQAQLLQNDLLERLQKKSNQPWET